MIEPFEYVQYWSVTLPPRFQVGFQNVIETYFDMYLERIKGWGIEVSPVERKMRVLKDEEGHDSMIRYSQRVTVTGADERLQHVMDMMNVSQQEVR